MLILGHMEYIGPGTDDKEAPSEERCSIRTCFPSLPEGVNSNTEHGNIQGKMGTQNIFSR